MSFVLDRLYHLHWVRPGVARSAQPYLGFYRRFLAAHGFKSLINLRGENATYGWWREEKRTAAALGIAHFDVRLSSRNIVSRTGLTALFDAFEAMREPVLIKCSGGQDRTGLAAALYLLWRGGPAALAEAQRQFAFWPYLHHPKTHQLWLRQFPAYAVEQAGAMPLGQWARERYDPKHFARWLEAKGHIRAYYAFQGESA
jgi:hypothetical protein